MNSETDWVTPQQFQRSFTDLYVFAARHACTALDMNNDDTPLTPTSALKGPGRELTNLEEIVRVNAAATIDSSQMTDLAALKMPSLHGVIMQSISSKNGKNMK